MAFIDTFRLENYGEFCATNPTTIEVTLAEVPAAAPAAGDFAVLVDGTAVEVSAVAKKPNTEKTYNLTIASLNGKEGQLSVNDKAAVIPGSDFGYDFKAPTVASVTGIDKNHVQIVFSEKVSKATAEITGNYDVTDLGGNLLGVSLATLQADGKTVLLTTPTPAGDMDTFANGYIAEVKIGVTDIEGISFAAVTKTIFSGVGTAPTAGPVALSAVYTPATTGKIVVKFDKEINATVDKNKMTVGGAALALGDTAAKTAAAELTITFTAASKTAYDAAATKDVVFVAGAVKDTAATPNSIAATTITPVSAAKLTSAAYDEATNILVLTFDKAVLIATLNTTNVTFNGNALPAIGAGPNTVSLKETSTSATLTLDLSRVTALNTLTTGIESVAATSRALVIAAGFGNDANGNAVADATYTSVLTYTDDVTAPVVESITYNATTDTMVITVNEDVTIPDLDKVVVMNGDKALFTFKAQKAVLTTNGVNPTADNAPSVSKKFNIVFGAAPEGLIEAASVDKQNLKIKFVKAGTAGQEALKDTAGNILAKDADVTVAIAYTDQDAVSLAATTQVASDKIELTFNKPLDSATATVLSNYKVVKTGSSPEVVLPLTGSVVLSGDKTSVILTLDKTSANYVNGYNYTVTPTVKDIYGNNYVASGNNTFLLDTGASATAYTLQSATYADASGDYAYGAGDTITLVFSGPVSVSGTVVATDFDLNNATLGNFTIAQGNTNEKLVITLGAGAALTGTPFDGSQTIDVAVGGQTHMVGANGVPVATGGAKAINKPDTTRPTLVKATYYDANADGAVSNGDTLGMEFSENIVLANTTVAAATVTGANNDFIISNGLTALTLNGNAAAVDGKVLTITISAATDLLPGTAKIDGDAAACDSIIDLWGNTLNTSGTAVVIAKSDTTAPTFSNVRIVKGTGTAVVLEVYDKVVFDISEAVNKDSLQLSGGGVNAFNFYAGPTAVPYTAADATKVTVNNITKTVAIEIAAGDGWIGQDISSLATFNILTNGIDTLFDANGNEIRTESGFGLPVTTP